MSVVNFDSSTAYADWLKATSKFGHVRSSKLKLLDKALEKYLACRTCQNHMLLKDAFNKWTNGNPESTRDKEAVASLRELVNKAPISAEIKQYDIDSRVYLFRDQRESISESLAVKKGYDKEYLAFLNKKLKQDCRKRGLIIAANADRLSNEYFCTPCDIKFFYTDAYYNGKPRSITTLNLLCHDSILEMGCDGSISAQSGRLIKANGNCPDYYLTKSQDRYDMYSENHTESYNTILKNLNYLKMQQELDCVTGISKVDNSDTVYDVCTIRHRAISSGGIKLSTLLKTLANYVDPYDEVYCSVPRHV